MTIPAYIFASVCDPASDDEKDDLSIISSHAEHDKVDVDEYTLEYRTTAKPAEEKNHGSSSDEVNSSINRWDSSSHDVRHDPCPRTPLQTHSMHLPITTKLTPKMPNRSSFSRRLSSQSNFSGSNSTDRRLSNSPRLSSLPRSKDTSKLMIRPMRDHSFLLRRPRGNSWGTEASTTGNHSYAASPPQLPQRTRSFADVVSIIEIS